MPRRSAMQKDLYTQLREATTPEERDRIKRRLRHAEVGQEGERGRVLDGLILIVNGRDPFADLRGGRPRVVYETRPREETPETDERTETEMVATEQAETPRTTGLSITEVAARTGAQPWKLRELESKGVIGPIGRSANGHDRVYTDSDVEAIEQALATPPKAATAAAAPQASKRASPTVSDRHHEIIYCPECRRQLSEKEYAMEVEDVVMTDHGGITRTLVTCFQHNVIAIKTEFVIRRQQGAGS